MRRTLSAVLSAATTVAALGVSGCAPRDESGALPAPVPIPPASVAAPQPGPLPPPEALADVMNRLADPNVPGPEKMGLVEDAAPQDGATFDRFAAALRDGGFSPVTFTATEMRWSDARPGDVIATITASGPTSTASITDAGQFAFPKEFRPRAGGWQLSHDSAEMLLAFGNSRTDARTETPTPTR